MKGRWDGNRLCVALALHLVEFAHELGALGQCVAHRQALADEASPKECDGKRDGRQALSGDSCDRHFGHPSGPG